MAERPLDKQNWQGRSITSFGPKFRLDMNNPTMGLNGTDVYNLYAVTDSKDVCITGLSEGGTYKIYNDHSIELIAGQKSQSNGVDIIITVRNGDICITAEKNGRVRIRGQNIMIDADEDVDIKAINNQKEKDKKFYDDVAEIRDLLYEFRDYLDRPSEAGSFYR